MDDQAKGYAMDDQAKGYAMDDQAKGDEQIATFKAELETALEKDHPDCDSSFCDIRMAIEQDCIFTAAHLLLGATDCPHVEQIVNKYGGFPKNDDGWPTTDFQWFADWSARNTWECQKCGTRNEKGKSSICENCLSEDPNSTEH